MFLKNTKNILCRFTKYRRIFHARLLVFALLFNIFNASFLPAVNAAGLSDDLLSEGQVIVICTPHGMKRVILDENGIPREDTENISEYCSNCLPFNKVNPAEPVNMAFYLPEMKRHILSFGVPALNFHDLIFARQNPRAPPLV